MNFVDINKCSGCTACMNICPKGCIKMVANAEGFLYPEVDMSKCVKCGLCEKVCPVDKTERTEPLLVCAAKNKNDVLRKCSTSGAMFSLIADYVLDNNGVVFGCELDSELHARHSFCEDREGLNAFRGAKYVQSDLGNVFKTVKQFLNDGRYVLFTGTPCQIAGLSFYLGKDYEKLIKCSLVCHSVPSPVALSSYIKELEDKHNSKAKNVWFREKSLKGWNSSNFKVLFEDGTEYKQLLSENYFMKGFNKGLFNRMSCENCSYKDFKECGDIMIADFWGIEDVYPDFVDNLGVSLMIINTKRGLDVFNKLKGNVDFRESTVEDAARKNPFLLRPSPKHINRSEFFANVEKEQFSTLVKRLLSEEE